jgi:hypothetical protein
MSGIAAKKAEHEVASVERDAEWAESDAVNAVDFALVAVEEAEYAVLDAALARGNADTMASSAELGPPVRRGAGPAASEDYEQRGGTGATELPTAAAPSPPELRPNGSAALGKSTSPRFTPQFAGIGLGVA